MKIGYARVSTDDQNPDLQVVALKKAGCKRIFIDKATGVHVKWPELAKCFKAFNKGDTLIVWKLDSARHRLGRGAHWPLGPADRPRPEPTRASHR